ncbi:MAG: uroporphyrinogen decarboxylase family protein [Bacillota bacterium]
MLTENWSELTPDEKFEKRFEIFMNPEGVEFAPGKKEAYQERVQMIKDAVELKKPTRVPVCPMIGFYPHFYSGITAEDAMYDYDKLGMALKKFHLDFQPDSVASSFLYGPGKIFELLEYKLYKWPGHGTNINTPYQCWEGEYMKGDEYDQLINDPTNYWIKYYLPRIFGALQPWQMLSPLTDIIELPCVGATFIPFGIPDVQESLKKVLEAGTLAMEWITQIAKIDSDIAGSLGAPVLVGGISKAPFDSLGDTMRGTEPLMLDIFRRPKKVHQAMEVLTEINIEMGVRQSTANKNPMVFIPLHKGADGFMSNKQYAEFYWPYLKTVINGMINEGLVPLLFAEGGYNERLEFLNDPEIPAGRMLWYFDLTDMAKAKEILGEKTCIAGNVPASLFKAGTPETVEAYVKDLIEKVGKEGFILSNGAVLDDSTPENLKAMFEAALKYGS